MIEKQKCKDCNKSLEDCACIEDTIEFTEADIETFTDWIFNPAEPNQALIDAAERYIAEDNYNRYYDDFIEGAKWQSERMYSEEEVIKLLQKALTHKDDGEIGSLVTAQGEIRPANFFSWLNKFKNK